MCVWDAESNLERVQIWYDWLCKVHVLYEKVSLGTRSSSMSLVCGFGLPTSCINREGASGFPVSLLRAIELILELGFRI